MRFTVKRFGRTTLRAFDIIFKGWMVSWLVSNSRTNTCNIDKKFLCMTRSLTFSDKLTFPWTISLSEICLSTLLENCVCKPLLKPLSANCTVGVSIKEGNENESIIALCVHVDFQSIIVTLTDKQVCEIIRFFIIFVEIY